MNAAGRREEISRVTLDDLDALVKLHEEYLNYGEGIRPHFETILRGQDSVASKHTLDEEITGIDIYTKGVSLSGGHEGLHKRIAELTKGKSVYTADAILVKREYRSLGVADKLCAASLRELKRRGAELILYELWVHPDGHIPASRMLRVIEKKVFLGRFENFYRDFHHFGYFCPICGEICVCAAEIYLAEAPK